MRKLVTTVLSTLAVGLAAASAEAWAADGASCYGGAVPAPSVHRQTIVLIDNTTTPDAEVIGAFVRDAARAAAMPGQRFVVLSFSALGPGQALVKHLDGVIEGPITDADLIETLPIKPYRATQRCVKAAAGLWPHRAGAEIRKVIDGVGDRARFRRSEIVHTLSQVLTDFGRQGIADTYMMVLSDAHEAGSNGISMYGRDGKPRTIDAREELRRLPRELQSRRVGEGTWSVAWFGLTLEGSGRQSGYFDVQSVEQVRLFWELLLVQKWGVTRAVIDRIPMNPTDGFDQSRGNGRFAAQFGERTQLRR